MKKTACIFALLFPLSFSSKGAAADTDSSFIEGVKKYFFILILIFIAILAVCHQAIAQDTGKKSGPVKNALFLELAGQGLVYSLNYERTLFNKGAVSLTARVGITPCLSRNHARGNGGQLFGLLNCLIGRKRIKCEIGLGMNNHFNFDPDISGKEYRDGAFNSAHMFSAMPDPPYMADLTAQLSFRHEITDKRWFYRISFIFSDLFERDGLGKLHHFFLPWGGFSFGKMF